ncbi:MAG: hypothetical protein NTW03_06145, partial [Verrucomicrobia bacterium]|nr:hypothetical protein [Verrucomicrobiota bacterium]
MRQTSHSHFDDAALFGVHALACWQAADTLKGGHQTSASDTLKGGHQTPPEWQNEKCWSQTLFRVRAYDLTATLTCGQAFRWEEYAGGWEGVVGGRWVRLRAVPEGILAETVMNPQPWPWLEEYLQT